MDINHEQKTKLLPLLKKHFNNDLKGKTLAVWGLSFKPYTDDIREAPALVLIKKILERGGTVSAYDPEAMDHVRAVFAEAEGLTLVDDSTAALRDADALLLITEWKQFRTVGSACPCGAQR